MSGQTLYASYRQTCFNKGVKTPPIWDVILPMEREVWKALAAQVGAHYEGH